MKRSVFIIFGLLLINILFISADPCQTSDGVTCCYGTCNWGLPGPDSTDGSCGGQCQNWGCVACAPSCSPSCACAVNTCTGQSYDDDYCGDNVLFVGSEGCDDGNLINLDGCSSTCNVEIYDNSYCGDGVLFNGFEECDDRNKVNGDGCSSVCVLQPEAYFLNSNGQRITEAHIGETVKLVFNNTGILNGSFSFEIFE